MGWRPGGQPALRTKRCNPVPTGACTQERYHQGTDAGLVRNTILYGTQASMRAWRTWARFYAWRAHMRGALSTRMACALTTRMACARRARAR